LSDVLRSLSFCCSLFFLASLLRLTSGDVDLPELESLVAVFLFFCGVGDLDGLLLRFLGGVEGLLLFRCGLGLRLCLRDGEGLRRCLRGGEGLRRCLRDGEGLRLCFRGGVVELRRLRWLFFFGDGDKDIDFLLGD